MARRIREWNIFALLAGAVAFGQPSPAHAIDSPEASVNYDRALQCLTLAIAYEAGFEPLEGKQAVGEVIINRAHNPAYPKSVCGVVFQGSARRTGCQFTFTCDGSLYRSLNPAVLYKAREVARGILAGKIAPQVDGATHYHANYVSPYWAPSLIRVGRIGAHIFYRSPGSPDRAQSYSVTSEPLIASLGPWLGAGDSLTQKNAASSTPTPANPVQPSQQFTLWGLAIR